MIDVEANIKTDERGFLYLEYLGKRLMTFRGEQKLVLKKLVGKAEAQSLGESIPDIDMRQPAGATRPI